MAYLTKNKVKEIIQNAPPGTSPAGIVSSLRQQGHVLEGYVDSTGQTQKKGIPRTLAEFGVGAVKGLGSTARQSSSFLNKITNKIPEQVKKFGAPISSAALPGVGLPLYGAAKLVNKIEPTISGIETKKGLQQGELTTPQTTAEKAGFIAERIAEFVNPAGIEVSGARLRQPLSTAAIKLYQKALKPRNVVKGGKVITEAEAIAKIGLDEGVWLTRGGVERVARKIDDFENALGNVIEEAKNQGLKIKTAGLKNYLDEAKTFFSNQVNVKEAKQAIKEIDEIGKNFVKQFGDEIPLEKAQEIKVATGQKLRKYYNQMSSAGIEGEKQATRFLKQAIVEKAPQAGEINQRLKNLYTFDQALSKAQGRIGNLNLLGLGLKIGAATGGSKGAVIGLLADLADAPSIKSGAGILLNKLSKHSKKGAIPINTLLSLIRSEIELND